MVLKSISSTTTLASGIKMSSFPMQVFISKDEAGFNDIAKQNSDGKKDFPKSHYNA